MKNHNFENKIIATFLEEDDAPIAPKKQSKKSSKKKAKIYLTLISLAIGAFGVILVVRGLFLFNPLAFQVSDSSYNVGLNRPIGFKSVNVDFADFPTSYPRELDNPQNPDGVYFTATNSGNSIISFLDNSQKLHKTVWVDGEVKKFIPLNSGNYYLVAIESPTEKYIDLVSYEGINFRIKDLSIRSIVQDLYYDEKENIFVFAFIDEYGIYNLEGMSTANKSFSFYKGSLDEGTQVINYSSNSFYLYSKFECQELVLTSKELLKTDCKNIKQQSLSKTVVYTKQSNNELIVYKYDQSIGQEVELVVLPKDSVLALQNGYIYSYSSKGILKTIVSEATTSVVSDKDENFIFETIFASGDVYFFKSKITNTLYKYDKSAQVDSPVSYVSFAVFEGIKIERELDGLNLDVFSDFMVYLPDNIYTL